MTDKKNILAIIGSASKKSSNLKLVEKIAELAKNDFNLMIFDELSALPHFNPELSVENTPNKILEARQMIFNADGIIICTPEYIFSIPSGLKNLIEWCVSTTIFSDKPTGLITASASGEKGHEELQLLMKTIGASFIEPTTLLIKGIKGKCDEQGNLIDLETIDKLSKFIYAFNQYINK